MAILFYIYLRKGCEGCEELKLPLERLAEAQHILALRS